MSRFLIVVAILVAILVETARSQRQGLRRGLRQGWSVAPLAACPPAGGRIAAEDRATPCRRPRWKCSLRASTVQRPGPLSPELLRTCLDCYLPLVAKGGPPVVAAPCSQDVSTYLGEKARLALSVTHKLGLGQAGVVRRDLGTNARRA